MELAFLDQAFWRQVWRLPLTRMLLLSLSLHVAVAMLVQPRSYTVAREETSVIDARLLSDRPAEALPAQSRPLPEPVEARPQSAAVQPVVPASPRADSAKAIRPSPEPVTAAAAKMADGPPNPAKETVPHQEKGSAPGLPSIPVMVDDTWYEAKQLDVQPKLAVPFENVVVYPLEAVRRGQEGSVKLKLKVDEFGVVQDVSIIESNPPGVFDDAVLAAVKKEHFIPAVKDGRPVRSLIYSRVDFKLRD